MQFTTPEQILVALDANRLVAEDTKERSRSNRAERRQLINEALALTPPMQIKPELTELTGLSRQMIYKDSPEPTAGERTRDELRSALITNAQDRQTLGSRLSNTARKRNELIKQLATMNHGLSGPEIAKHAGIGTVRVNDLLAGRAE